MSSLGSPNPFFIAGKKAYEVERSLRFNNDDNTRLVRTIGSTSNRRTFTYSFWLKRSMKDAEQYVLYNGHSSSTPYFDARFVANSHTFEFIDYGSSGYAMRLITNRVFRDPSAWYHFVIAIDTTQSTSSDRAKLYINGVQETSFGTESYPSQNHDTGANVSGHIQVMGTNKEGTSNDLDGYLAEVNFIDGSQLTPSSFGATDVLTGQWNPKKYVGSYGTNGFYLNFSDNSGTTATTLGKDSSGNGNNFTPNNFSVSAGAGNDSLEDTPTNNFCTMNPLVPSPSVTWANGNLDLGGSSSSEYNQTNTSTFGVSSGKWYAEVKVTYSTTNVYVGICPITTSPTTNLTNNVTDGAVLRMDNTLFIEGSSPSSGTSISSGNTIGIALDMDNQKVWFSVQGTYLSSGNPATGANATFDGITAGETIAICARPLNGTLNFNFGQRAFSYTPPTGFKKLNSANLPGPTILLPNKHFNTLLYAGNGAASRAITGLDFQPDWVWLKSRTNTDYHQVHDAVRGIPAGVLFVNVAAAEDSNYPLASFDSNGFTTSADASDQQNTNGQNYVAWNWNAGDTDGKTYTVTVVSDSGNKYRFDGFGTSAVTLDLAEGGTYIFNYPSAHPFRFSTTSDGTHGGGSEYTTGVTVISSTSIQIVVAASAPTLYYYCSSHSGMGGQVNTNSTLGSSNFDGTIQSVVKASPMAGFSIINYTGTGSTATVGHGLGVAPEVIILKDRNASGAWKVLHKEAVSGSYEYFKNVLYLNSSSSFAGTGNSYPWGNTEPTSSVFSLGNIGSESNRSGSISSRNYVAYCFSGVSSYSKFGSYQATGDSDGPFIYTNFRPAWILIKNTSLGQPWVLMDNKINPHNLADTRLSPSSSAAELTSGDNYVDILSNGFKVRSGSSTDINYSTSYPNHIYLAFAEAPFRNARAR